MEPEFHLSLDVPSLQPSLEFFTDVLSAKVRHRDPSGYVNLELARVQLTLKETPAAHRQAEAFHFGINVDVETFEAITARVRAHAPQALIGEPRIVDAGTPRERRKLHLRCPAGYLVEVKGFGKEAVA